MSIRRATILGRHGAAAALGIALLISTLVGSTAAVHAAAPMAGTFHVFGTPGDNGGGTVLFTGAIAGYGHTVQVDKAGNHIMARLQKGTFKIDVTALNAAMNAAQPVMNPKTCSGYVAVTQPIKLSGGTGLYAGMTGTGKVTLTFAVIMPKYASGANKGQCNESNNANPLDEYSSVSGAGTVKFG